MRRTEVRFDRPIRAWDGFGVNYVEASQTRDYVAEPQDYGGFGVLSELGRQEVFDLTFGPNGLLPGLIKMFLDPFHQPPPGPGYSFEPDVQDPSAYDHATTTRWMRYYVREGLQRTRARGDDLQVIVTLYGPPAWMTRQGFVRGRDLDPRYRHECAKYMISWARYLREVEGLPVRYISLHNEGEDWMRWPADASTADDARHDYNLYWPPEQVADFLASMPGMLEQQGMADVGMAPGETTNWYRFAEWGYAQAIADHSEALRGIGLITSHGFYGPTIGRWFGDWRSLGIDILRARRPDLHAWVTSTSWSNMDVYFVNELRNGIYAAKVNGIIPWAAVQWAGKWVGGDPNPGTAFRVYDDGSYSVEPGYYYYKQVCRAGQPGMGVAQVVSNDSEVGLIGFAANGTRHPDALVVLNLGEATKELRLTPHGSAHSAFDAYRTGPDESYASLGRYRVEDGAVAYDAPPKTVTTLFGVWD